MENRDIYNKLKKTIDFVDILGMKDMAEGASSCLPHYDALHTKVDM